VILFARQSYLSSVLLDLQPGLAVVLSETTGTNTTRYVHGPRGIHAQKDSANVWEHPLQDGLGSVRTVTDNAGAVLWATQYEPYGTGFGTVGTAQTNYGFTGEYGLPGGLLHLRARNYHPALGVFTALDPFEGMMVWVGRGECA
jgi:RHS repeat-associated protein